MVMFASLEEWEEEESMTGSMAEEGRFLLLQPSLPQTRCGFRRTRSWTDAKSLVEYLSLMLSPKVTVTNSPEEDDWEEESEIVRIPLL